MNQLSKVEAILQEYCTSKAAAAAVIDKSYVELWAVIGQYLAAGGKRMRPRLVLMAYDAYRKSDEVDITPVAAAWELLHACLLVHDDIIDRDTTRHGVANIAGTYQSIYHSLTTDAPHYAMSTALLGGDLLLMSAYEVVNTANLTSDQKLMAQEYINKALFAVAGGELVDTIAALYPVPDSNPHAVAAFKTASYSLQLPLQCGAALAGAPSSELDKLSQIGLHLGVAYQLRDDLLGVFGDSEITGKSNRSDIFEKKRTALIQAALAGLSRSESNNLANLFSPGHSLSGVEAEDIVQLIIKSGAKDSIEKQIESETHKALKVIDSLTLHDNHKKAFSEIASKLIKRTH